MASIRAIKGNITRNFTQRQWDLMPSNKYGWKIAELVEAPPEVTAEKAIPLPEKVSIKVPAPPEITEPTKNTKTAPKAKAKQKKK